MKTFRIVFSLFYLLAFGCLTAVEPILHHHQTAVLTLPVQKQDCVRTVTNDVDEACYPALFAFLKKYNDPESCTSVWTLCTTTKEGMRCLNATDYFPRLNNGFYLKKPDIMRVINALRLKACIKANQLETVLGVTEKYLVKIGAQWKVVSKEVAERISVSNKRISLKIAQALFILMCQTGLSDIHEGNWRWDGDILVCIDTENRTFISRDPRIGIGTILEFLHQYLEPEAREWLENKKRSLPVIFDWYVDKPIDSFKAYDDPEIDFDKVEQEFKELLQKEIVQ